MWPSWIFFFLLVLCSKIILKSICNHYTVMVLILKCLFLKTFLYSYKHKAEIPMHLWIFLLNMLFLIRSNIYISKWKSRINESVIIRITRKIIKPKHQTVNNYFTEDPTVSIFKLFSGILLSLIIYMTKSKWLKTLFFKNYLTPSTHSLKKMKNVSQNKWLGAWESSVF